MSQHLQAILDILNSIRDRINSIRNSFLFANDARTEDLLRRVLHDLTLLGNIFFNSHRTETRRAR